jgi:hypothetical protein
MERPEGVFLSDLVPSRHGKELATLQGHPELGEGVRRWGRRDGGH